MRPEVEFATDSPLEGGVTCELDKGLMGGAGPAPIKTRVSPYIEVEIADLGPSDGHR
jgi:hypothetical protein